MSFMIRRTASAIAVAVMASGCAIGPDYVAPDVPMPGAFAGKDRVGATQESVVDKWWGNFKDNELDSLIVEGVRSNNDLQGALARVNQSRAIQQRSFLDLFPTVTSEGTYNRTRFPTSTFAGGALGAGQSHITNEYYSAGFDAVWELDIYGRVRRGYEAADAQTAASVATLHDALRMLIGEIARTYFELRGNQAQILVARENARTQEQVVTVAEALFKGGQTTEFDVVRAKSQLANTQAAIPQLEAGVKAAMFRLAVLTGRQPAELVPQLEGAKPLPTYNGPVTIGSPGDLLKRRPDIRAAENDLHAATANIGVAQGELFPKVTFVGSISVQAPTFKSLSSGDADAYGLAPGISWPAFNIGRTLAAVDQAQAVTKEALHRYEQTVLLALEDTENALAQFGASRERRDLLRQSVENSAKAVEISRVQYENGLVDLLPVLDAQRSLLASQLQLTESETNLATSLVAVFKALGGGWDEAVVQVVADNEL
jgi:multidrug efflux system outer membrane protein